MQGRPFSATPAKAGVQERPDPCQNEVRMKPRVYILASQRNGTIYVGVTSDLSRRVSAHRGDVVDSFTKRYGVHRLAYAEFHATMPDAILREKRIKKWRRAWKIMLIEQSNPTWEDLSDEIG